MKKNLFRAFLSLFIIVASVLVFTKPAYAISGTLTQAAPCVVPIGGNTCSTNLNWTIASPNSQANVIYQPGGSNYVPLSGNLSGSSGSQAVSATFLSNGSGPAFRLYNGGVTLLAEVTVNPVCAAGSTVIGDPYTSSPYCLANHIPITDTQISGPGTTSASITILISDAGWPPFSSLPGVCYGTSSGSLTNCITGTASGNSYYVALSSLNPDTTYYYRSYVTNTAGTGYSATKSFHTLVPLSVNNPTVSAITPTSATLGANVVSYGNGTITGNPARGTCYGTTSGPTTNCLPEGGTTTGVFSHSRTALTPNTFYYYRGYATSMDGTAYSTDGTFTTLPITVSVVATPSIYNVTPSAIVPFTYTPTTNLGATECRLLDNTQTSISSYQTSSPISRSMPSSIGSYGYYVQCRNTVYTSATATSNLITVNVAPIPTAPTVTTSAVSGASITQTSATGGGNLISDGGSTVLVSGLVWSTLNPPTTADSKTSDGFKVPGPWTSNMTGLTPSTPGTTYYVRAYAVNSVGTGYGATVSFTTAPVPVVNGACAASHYSCNTGTSASNVIATSAWTWNCNGSNGGTNASCSEPIPSPTNFIASCPSPGTTASFSWTLPSGYTLSYFRIHDNTSNTDLSSWIPENVSDTGPSTSVATTPGHNYTAGVHTRLSNGSYSSEVFNSFSCTPAPVMSGTLTPAFPTCTIGVGASTCNVSLTGSVTNPEGSVSAVTASGMSNVNLPLNTGGTVSVPVPITGRTFNLYNNSKPLAQSTATATCVGGTNWNSTSGTCATIVNGGWSAWSATNSACGFSGTQTRTCTNPTPANGGADCSGPSTQSYANAPCAINGSCLASHYNCNTGTSANNVQNISGWTWDCSGSNGGTSASCSETIPAPTNFSTSCAAPGTTATFTWTLPSGYTQSYLRLTDNTTGVYTGLIPELSPSGTSPYTFTTIPGHSYTSYVTTRVGTSYSSLVYSSFSCTPAMAGTLNPASTACIIFDGQPTCNVSLTGSVTNPEGSISAVTASGMSDANLSSNTGGTVSVPVPITGRTFNLYNNAKLLAQSTATASCAGDMVSGICHSKPTITASSGANGAVTPAGVTSVVYGTNSTTYSITPSTNYSVANVLIDGSSVGALTTYTFSNVTANHTISATFAASSCGNGATNPPTCSTCPAGSAMVSGSCTPVTVSVNASTPYNTTPNTNVSFAYTPSTNSGTTECRLLDNTQASLTSYQGSSPIVYPSVNGVGAFGYYVQCRNMTTTSAAAISNLVTVNTSCAVGSDFVSGACHVKPTITATQGANGTISPSGTTTVVYGSGQAYTITPNSGYNVASLIVDGSTIAANSSYSFSNITVNHTISATFTASSCGNGATNPPTCNACTAGSAMISGTCTPVTVSVSASTPYNTTPNTNVSFAYTPSTNSGTTECKLLDNNHIALTSYQASSPIVNASPSGVNSYAYYVQCRNTTTTSAIAESNQVIVNTSCAVGSDFVSGACHVRPTITVTQAANGTISPGTQSVVYGSSQAFTITPNSNYNVASLIIDGSTIASSSSYTFSNVIANHSISATFTASTCANGAVNYPACTVDSGGFCLNGAINPPTCTTFPTIPSVTTTAPSSITQTTATGGGNVTSNGGSTVTVSGIAWSVSANPTTASTKTTNGWAIGGPWTSNMTGLTANTLYHVRAYATNNVGTAYGSDVTFTTTAATCANGATNYPTCTINSGGSCINGATNPPTCDTFACSNGATNPPTCNTCSSGYAMVSGTCTPVTVSVSASTPYNVTPGANVSFVYTPSTNSGSTECRLLDNTLTSLTSYQVSSPIVRAAPNTIGSYGYYVQCRNTTTTSVTANSNLVTVNVANACVPNQGNDCISSPNSCGQVNSGSIQCGGSCSAVTPPDSSCGGGGSCSVGSIDPLCGGSPGCPVGSTNCGGGSPGCPVGSTNCGGGSPSCPIGSTNPLCGGGVPSCPVGSTSPSCDASGLCPVGSTDPSCNGVGGCASNQTGTPPNCVNKKQPIYIEN